MNRTQAAIGSAAFFVLAPGTVAGLVPWWITGYRLPELNSIVSWVAVVLGFALVAAGLAVLIKAFVRFVTAGRGTPAPIAPTEYLVVGGSYRHVRNPMYVAVVAVIWIAFITVLFVLPPNALSGWIFGGCSVAVIAWYFIAIRGRFQGPAIVRPDPAND